MRKNPTILVFVIMIAAFLILAGIAFSPAGKQSVGPCEVPTRADPNVSVNIQGQIDLAEFIQKTVIGGKY